MRILYPFQSRVAEFSDLRTIPEEFVYCPQGIAKQFLDKREVKIEWKEAELRFKNQRVNFVSCAPFVSSPHDVVKKMLEVARAGKDDVLCDLGCGDGRILTTAVKDFGIKSAMGYEIREDLFKQASAEVEKQKLIERVRIFNKDLFQADLKDATLITLYLTTYANERLKPKLRSEARPGSRIVSHDFMINGWKPSRKENYNEHTIYVYTIPDAYSI